MIPLHATSQLLLLGPGESTLSLILDSSCTGISKYRPPHDEYLSFGLFVIAGRLLVTQRRRLLFSSIMGDQDLVTMSRCGFFWWRACCSSRMGFASFVASVQDVANRTDLHVVGWAHRQRVPLAGPASVVLSIFVQAAAALVLTSVEVLLLLFLSMASFVSRVHCSFCAWLRMSLLPMVLDIQRICSHSVVRFPVLVIFKYLRAVAGSIRHINAPAVRWISETIVSASFAFLAFAISRKYRSGGYKSRRTEAYCRRASAGRSLWWKSLYVAVLAACLLLRSADSAPTIDASKSASQPPVDLARNSASPSAAPQLSTSGSSALSSSSAASTSSPSATIDCLAVPSAVRRAMEKAASDHNLSRDDALEYCAQCKVLVIEVVTDEVHRIINYKRIAGQMGGLNKAKIPFVKRIIIAVDGPEGLYGAACLDDNVHYQVGMDELPSFCGDVTNLGFSIYDGSASTVPTDGCGVLCLPNVSHHLPDEYFSVGSKDASSSSFRSLCEGLNASAIFRYLSCLSPDAFDSDRGNLALHFGYQALNSTVTGRDDLCGFASPSLSRPSGSGWGVGSSLSTDMSMTMAAMTKLSDFATALHRMDPLFGSKTDDRAKQYALKIHPDNRAESLTMSLAPSADGEYLLAHLDHLNDSIDGYQYNVSFYGYYRDSASGHLRRMHVGIYSRRVCGTTSARSGRAVDLLEDLTAYLASLPKWRVSYNPGEIFSHAYWELEGDSKDDPKSYEVGRIPVHMNKQVL